jgi:N-methylhydantoinase A/oxoprolinase/acetone carboxylase beta subunit
MGGIFLSGQGTGLVIDIGGTTSDICLVHGGNLELDDAVVVGNLSTAIRAARVRSIGLGGDSEIRCTRERDLSIGPRRVLPISHLACLHPEIKGELLRLRGYTHAPSMPSDLEYWFLSDQHIASEAADEPVTRELIDLLRHGPCTLSRLLTLLRRVHPAQLNADRLLNREVIGRSCLTPTDVLQADGRLALWDAEAATAATEIFGRVLGDSPTHLVSSVMTLLKLRMVDELVSFIRGMRSSALGTSTWFLHNAVQRSEPYLQTQIRLECPIVGLGAPAGLLLKQVAELLHTELILPSHYEVGSAVGAAVANVVAMQEALILPLYGGDDQDKWHQVQISGSTNKFRSLKAALTYAKRRATQIVKRQAIRAGAVDPAVSVTECPLGSEQYKVSAQAVGNPRLGFRVRS